MAKGSQLAYYMQYAYEQKRHSKDYKKDRRKFFSLILLTAGVIAVLVSFLQYLSHFRPLL